jgi:hypothetical protein
MTSGRHCRTAECRQSTLFNRFGKRRFWSMTALGVTRDRREGGANASHLP